VQNTSNFKVAIQTKNRRLSNQMYQGQGQGQVQDQDSEIVTTIAAILAIMIAASTKIAPKADPL
jgi:prenyltransferase beta subunit